MDKWITHLLSLALISGIGFSATFASADSWQNYSNAGIGVQIQVPSDWKIRESQSDVMLSGPQAAGQNVFVNIKSIQDDGSLDKILETHHDWSLTQNKKKISNDSIDHVKGVKIDATGAAGPYPEKVVTYVAMKQGRALTVTLYAANEMLWNEYRDTLEKMKASIVWK